MAPIVQIYSADIAPGISQRKRGISTRQGDTVRFRISDVFLPGPAEMLADTSQDPEMEGQIVDFSDSGLEQRVFAVVQLPGPQTVVVPVARLEVVEANESPTKREIE